MSAMNGRISLALAAAVMVVAFDAAAVELVPGGYGAFPPERPVGAPGGRMGELAPFVIDFTPRASGLLFLGRMSRAGLPRTPSALAETAGDGSGRVRPAEEGGFVLGGAFRLSSLEVGGTIGRAQLFAGDGELLTAGFRYGGFSATFGYVWQQSAIPEAGELLLLRTDLSAASWLSLESDLLLGQTSEDEPVAVGRIGVRLHF